MKLFKRLIGRSIVVMLILFFAVLIGIFFVLREISPDAVTAFVGVLVGAGTTGMIQYGISNLDRAQELKLAALDLRLKAHQEAYTHWIRLRFAERSGATEYEGLFQAAVTCQKWWDENCIYLSDDARAAFFDAFYSAHKWIGLAREHEDIEELKEAWEGVERAGDIILGGVYLPPISDLDQKRVT